MPRSRSAESIEAEKHYKTGEKLVDIARSMRVPESTVRRWKSDQDWDGKKRTAAKKKLTERSEMKPNVKPSVVEEDNGTTQPCIEGRSTRSEYWRGKEGSILLQGWAREGLTLEQISLNMGIVTSTLHEWKRKYSEISEALKKGKEVVDFAVESALLRKAMTGDTTAMIFWLKNRRIDKWRDRPLDEQRLELERKRTEASIRESEDRTAASEQNAGLLGDFMRVINETLAQGEKKEDTE